MKNIEGGGKMLKGKVYLWRHLPDCLFKDLKKRYKARKNDYYNVFILPTREEMYEFVEKKEKKTLERDYNARTLCFYNNYYNNETNKLVKTGNIHGYMYFNEPNLTFNAIAHECTHAVLGYIGREMPEILKYIREYDYNDLTNDAIVSEELMAYMIGDMSNDIISIAFPDKE